MANELPEVVPEVQSMPTTGWFCQTDGAARRRITKNTSSFPNEGTFDVTGVPGHSHNANAVVSVDANYSKYRTSAITIPARVWSAAALAFPVGLLTDSEVVDNESERYDRAIERCVGYTALFPENCTGHIREPTRSIGEVRTLVAPKARLDTLTYVEDRAGWRVPNDGDDVKEQTERDAMVSDFPDIYIDVRPNTQVLDAATINGGVAPSSLYLESATYRYSIESADDEQTIGTLAWDGTLRFVWDNDNKRYSTIEEVTVKLTNVATRAKADGAVVQANGVNQVYAEGAAHPSIMVKFPIMYTSKAFSGYCWLSHLDTEQSITYATRLRGADQSKRIEVDVIGISNDQGPQVDRDAGLPHPGGRQLRAPRAGHPTGVARRRHAHGLPDQLLRQVRRVHRRRHPQVPRATLDRGDRPRGGGQRHISIDAVRTHIRLPGAGGPKKCRVFPETRQLCNLGAAHGHHVQPR